MGVKYIPLTVENEYIKGTNVVIGAARSHNDVYLKITFGEMWDSTTKQIVWLDANKQNPVVTLLTSSMLEDGTTNVYNVPVPATPKSLPGKMTMTIKGAVVEDDEETKATLTAAAEFTVLESAWTDDADEQEVIEPTVAEQLQAEIETLDEDKQDKLVSGTNIKTINGGTILGSGNIELLEPDGDGSNVTVGFTQSGIRTNIATGESLSTLFGKIKKWFADLGTAAFKDATNSVASGSTDLVESGAVHTAVSGKQDALVSGTNIKTINGNSLLGSGNLPISGGANDFTIEYGVTNSSDIYSNFLGGARLFYVDFSLGTDTAFLVSVDSDLSSSTDVYFDVDLFGHYAGGGYKRYRVQNTTYTQVEAEEYLTDADLSTYAPKNSPTFTGTPTAPTPPVSDDSTRIATTKFVQDVAVLTKTISDGLAHFTDAANAPLKSLIANINAEQAGSGTPTPSNPRAISGFTGVNVTRAGKNLVKIATGSTTNQGITFAKADGKVTMSGTCGTSNAWHTISANNFTLKAGTYTLSGGGDTNMSMSLRTPVTNIEVANTSSGDATFTLTEDTLLWLRCRVSANYAIVGSVTFSPQIEVGSVATAWEIYGADTYAISWNDEAGTVYGGTLNVTTGVLTLTHILTTFDGSVDENWLFNTVDASRNRMSIALPSVKIPPSYSDDYIANWLGPSLASSPQVWLASYTNQGILRVGVPTTIASVSDWLTYLGNDPLDIVYPIATPITYQLTPTEVQALIGTNNIWSDANGDVEVEYVPNTDLATVIDDLQKNKQDKLVSGTSIKTVNSTSLLGSGDVAVQATLVSGTNIKTVGGQTLLGGTDVPIALPYVAIADFDSWNTALELAELSADVAITLPSVPSGVTAEVRITASQGAGNSYKITLTAPTGTTITDGSTPGASLAITPTAEKYIEISAAVIGNGTIVSVLTHEV